VAGTVLGRIIPWFYSYRVALQLLGVVLLVSGVYWRGSYANELKWKHRVEELQQQVVRAEAQSRQVNEKIKIKVVTKIRKVKDHNTGIKKIIEQKEKIINKNCTVPSEAIDLLNQAAQGPGDTP